MLFKWLTFSLPPLTKNLQQCWLGGRSEIPSGVEVCDACPSCTSVKGNYYIYNILVKIHPKRRPLILQLRGDGLQMSSQKHTPSTFPCCSTVCLQTGVRSMNDDRWAGHPGSVKPAEQVGCYASNKSLSSRLVQRGSCSGEHQSTNSAHL